MVELYELEVINGSLEPGFDKSPFRVIKGIGAYEIKVGVTTEENRDPVIIFVPKAKNDSTPIFHHVAKSREELLDRGISPRPDMNDTMFGWSGTFLIGSKFRIVDGGNKAIAHAPSPTGKIVRIATDVEILKNTSNIHDIYWYYDPA